MRSRLTAPSDDGSCFSDEVVVAVDSGSGAGTDFSEEPEGCGCCDGAFLLDFLDFFFFFVCSRSDC